MVSFLGAFGLNYSTAAFYDSEEILFSVSSNP